MAGGGWGVGTGAAHIAWVHALHSVWSHTLAPLVQIPLGQTPGERSLTLGPFCSPEEGQFFYLLNYFLGPGLIYLSD